MFETDWFSGRGVDEPPPRRPIVLAWWIWSALAIGMILAPLVLGGCASPCEDLVVIVGADETHVALIRGRFEVCPR